MIVFQNGLLSISTQPLTLCYCSADLHMFSTSLMDLATGTDCTQERYIINAFLFSQKQIVNNKQRVDF